MKKIIKDIKNLKGFILGIGELNLKIIDAINKNNFVSASLLTKNYSFKDSSYKENKKSKGKNINFKKLKKYFKKNKPDYIICNIDDIYEYLKYFVRDSLFITTNKIYIYSETDNYDLNFILKRYSRYKNINAMIDKNTLIVETSNYKYNKFKNILYFISDTIYNIFDFASNIITS